MSVDARDTSLETPAPTQGKESPEDGSEARPAPKKKSSSRRRRWRRALLVLAFLCPLFIGGLWIAVHSIPWMGPLVANTLRAAIGKDNVTKLEDFVYGIEDKVNLTLRANQKPKAYWKVAPPPPVPAPTKPVATEESEPEEEAEPRLPPFALQPVGPALETFSAEGDGQWVPMLDPRRPGEAPRMFKTLLHPDKSRSWAEVFVVAIDLRTVSVRPVMGYQEPRTEKKEAEGYVRPAKIPKAHWDALLAAFNGGFMAEHGHYGVYFDGITFIDPKEDACTMAQFTDGHLEIRSFARMSDRQDQMVWYRQAPNCMYEDGKMHPNLEVYRARKWGATLDGETVIRRSAVGLSADQNVLYVGISNHTNAKVMALGMHHAGAENVAQMDVNWSYPKFVTYELDDNGRLIPVALAEGFEFNEHLYLRERSMRDFFYLARKEEVEPLERKPPPGARESPPETEAEEP